MTDAGNTPQRGSIFLCYRREDSGDATGRIYDRLIREFPGGAVFKDVDSIPFGVDFREHVRGVLGDCRVVLVIIGPRWADIRDESGGRRLDDEEDYVRIELEIALGRPGLPVIPVIVGGAAFPKKSELPDGVRSLRGRNGPEVRRDPDFDHDMARLIGQIKEWMKSKPPPVQPPPILDTVGIVDPGPVVQVEIPKKEVPMPEEKVVEAGPAKEEPAKEEPAKEERPGGGAPQSPPRRRKTAIIAAVIAIVLLGSVAGWWFGVEEPRRAQAESDAAWTANVARETARRAEEARQEKETADAAEKERIRLDQEKADVEAKRKQIAAQAEAATQAQKKLEDDLITAWQSVREKDSPAAVESAKKLFQSVISHSDPVIAYQGEAGLAAIASIEAGGGVIEATDLYPVSSRPMLGKDGLDHLSPSLWGFIDRNGKLVIPASWEDAYPFSEGLALVRQNGKFGLIDRLNKLVIPTTFASAYPFREGLAGVKQDGKWGFIDRSGKPVVPATCEDIRPFSEGLALVKENGKWGFIDRNGKLVIPTSEDAYPFSEGLASVKQGVKYGVIDRSGMFVIPATWEDAWPFSEGLARVQQDGKWGFMDRSGKIVIPATWDGVGSFVQGLARVKQDGKWGLIDHGNKLVIPAIWGVAYPFSKGLVPVWQDGKYGFIDRSGRVVIPTVWDWFENLEGFGADCLLCVYQKMVAGSQGDDKDKPVPARMLYLDRAGKTVWSSDGKGVGEIGKPLDAASLKEQETSTANTVPAVAGIQPRAATKERPFVNTLGMKFVPAVNYTDGSKALFCIWDTRVKDYAAFAAASSGVNEEWKKPGFTQTDEHPVVKVSWEDATAFCAWLTKKERGSGHITEGMEYRLPTDVEWSYAVGLGKEEGATPKERSTVLGGVYPWGKTWPPPQNAGNYNKIEGRADDGYEDSSPVGSFAANEMGLYDMGGNVWQWCQDWYDIEKTTHVNRGASFADGLSPGVLHSQFRNYNPPGYRSLANGFRCVVEVPAPNAQSKP